MSLINRIAPEDAPPELRAIHERIRAQSASQSVAHLWQAWGAHPAGLEATFATYRALMDDPAPLTPAQAEMIALVVSANNGCAYCVAHHGAKLARLVGEELARDAGILRAVEIAAFYAYVNRVAMAIGVELEPRLKPWVFGAQF